jgi:hypothetical protein
MVDISVRVRERRLLTTGYAHQDRIKLGPDRDGYPAPSSHPELTVNLVGPFVSRRPHYDLGTLVVGRRIHLELIVGNHSVVPLQKEPVVSAGTRGPVQLSKSPAPRVPVLKSGEVFRDSVELEVIEAGSSGQVDVSVAWGGFEQSLVIRHGECVPAEQAAPLEATISRYPGATRSAFAWRGDMDVYDTSTHQSIAGLEAAFGLAARYRFPQTLYLSTRLTISPDEADAFWAHWGLDRGQDEIPAFIEWMQRHVDLRHSLAYPFQSEKSYAVELGNHGHLHYGTHMAADAANGWRPGAKMGAGQYPWTEPASDSEREQRDNAIEANRLSVELFDFPMRSWAMPDRTADGSTAAAMLAAGCTVLSDSDITARDNVLRQPPPHHPSGTAAVELTKRYPGDPEHIYHVAMIKYWIGRGLRRQIPVLFMCHQHMRQWDGHACTRFTEHIMRYVLTRFHGDFHVNTVYGIGSYWNAVMSPTGRTVDVEVQGRQVLVNNRGREALESVPIDVTLNGGGTATYLVDLPAGGQRTLTLTDD